jgi:hypothetical protein
MAATAMESGGQISGDRDMRTRFIALLDAYGMSCSITGGIIRSGPPPYLPYLNEDEARRQRVIDAYDEAIGAR